MRISPSEAVRKCTEEKLPSVLHKKYKESNGSTIKWSVVHLLCSSVLAYPFYVNGKFAFVSLETGKSSRIAYLFEDIFNQCTKKAIVMNNSAGLYTCSGYCLILMQIDLEFELKFTLQWARSLFLKAETWLKFRED